MQIFYIPKDFSDPELIIRFLNDENALVLKTNAFNSEEEAQLAYFLAKKSFNDKSNIAKKFKYEFLLFLTGKIDIKSAANSSLIQSNLSKDAILIAFDEKASIPKHLKKHKLQKNANPLDLERISLSRIKN